jgi:hypothetical protein
LLDTTIEAQLSEITQLFLGQPLSDNINPQVSNSPLGTDLPIDVTLRAIQDAEIDCIVESGRAQLPRAPGVTYRAPSGRLMKSFLRIGNIQRSRSALDAVFFWLVPYLRDCTGLVTDTWSISSIAMNISRRLAVYSSTDTMAAPCPVEMLAQYLDGSPARATEAVEIIGHLLARTTVTPPSRIVFLISATHTGSLIGHVETLLLQRGIDAASVFFVALFKLGPTNAPGTALRDLSAGPGADDFTPLDPAQISDDLEPIDIDEQVYFPLQYRDVSCVVRQPETVAFREFLDRYDSAEVVKVHRTVSDDGARRHHAIWIDTVALAGHPVFKHCFAEYVRGLDPIPQLIITPLHEAATILGELALAIVRERYDAVRLIPHSNLSVSTPPQPGDVDAAEAIDSIPDNGAILILDDAFITGTRLQSYQTHLRNRTFAGRRHYLVAIARPPALANWILRQRMAGFRGRVAGASETYSPCTRNSRDPGLA